MDSHKAMQLVSFTHGLNLSTFKEANQHEIILRYPFDDETAYTTPRPSAPPIRSPSIVRPTPDNPTSSDTQRTHVALAPSAPPARTNDATPSTDRSLVSYHLSALRAEIKAHEKELRHAPCGTDENKTLRAYVAQPKVELEAVKRELAVLWKVDLDAKKALWHACGQR